MTDREPGKSQTEVDRVGIRWAAALCALVVGFVSLAMHLNRGEAPQRAATLAAVEAAGGLLIWAAYHLASGRAGGLALFVLATLPLPGWVRGHPLRRVVGLRLELVAAQAAFALVLGLTLRAWGRARGRRKRARAVSAAEVEKPLGM